MANRHVCSKCMRNVRHQLIETRTHTRLVQFRPLTTSTTRFQKQAYKAPTPRAAQPPPTPHASVKQGQADVEYEPRISAPRSLAEAFREAAPSLTETYVAYGATEILTKECSRVADYTIPEEQRKEQLLPDVQRDVDIGVGKGWWYEELGLEAKFMTWAQITFLHMWFITVRLRQFPPDIAGIWHQHLTDHFFYSAEDRMTVLHGLSSRAIRNRNLKDLFAVWRGAIAAYDQGLIEGDAVLAAAIWRNILGSREDIDLTKLAQITAYVRSVVKGLEGISDEDVGTAQVVFEDPSAEGSVVVQKSDLWKQPWNIGDKDASGSATPSTESPTKPGKWTKSPQGTVIKRGVPSIESFRP